MSKEVPWNEIIYMEFSRLAMLSPIEREIMRTRIMGYSIAQQSLEFNMSEASIHRTIKSLKKKYDQVQPYSNLLPPRRKSKEEKWMDTH